MPKKRRRDEILIRTAEVSSFNAHIGLRIDNPRDPYPEIETSASLEVRGTLSAPVRDIRDVVFSVFPREQLTVGTARPPSVGAIIQIRPHLVVVVHVRPADFDRLWSLALAGDLKHAYMAFTKPHYRSALVTNLSFSNERDE